MITYLLVVLLCPAGTEQCYAREFGDHSTLEQCAAGANEAGAQAVVEFTTAWRDAVGVPPPMMVTVGCQEERST